MNYRAIWLGGLLALGLLGPGRAKATSPVTDCVIDRQTAVWMLQRSGAARVTEDLDVNCGDLAGKHGIYRVLPTRVPNGSRPASYRRETPVTVLSITDQDGHPYAYETSGEGDALSIKIGSADVLISGLLHYRLEYEIGNAVWPDPDSGEYHVDLNVVGQFWQLPIDAVDVVVELPADVSSSAPLLTVGGFGSTTLSTTAEVVRLAANRLQILDQSTYQPEMGLTLSLLAPAEAFAVDNYQYSTWEKWGGLLWLLWPILLLWPAIRLWRQSGRDARVTKAHLVQYTPPADLPAYEAFLLQHNGGAGPAALSGLIVGLAVRGYLKLEKPTGGLFSSRQLEFIFERPGDGQLASSEKAILSGLFGSATPGERVKTAELRSALGRGAAFRRSILKAKEKGRSYLQEKGWFEKNTRPLWRWLIVATVGVALSVALLPWFGLLGFWGPLLTILTLLIMLVFLGLMPRRTPAGAEVEWQLRGFQDYLTTAERYRLEFSEKENLFEKYLPYAVAFGVVKQWARAMRQLYGEEYWSHYHPAWYVGAFDLSDINSFSTAISDLASDISNSMSSGTSGGASGGGAGGGGGGSW